MLLRKYIREYCKNIISFARDTGISDKTLFNILYYQHMPNLITAIKIHEYTAGLVTFYDLVPTKRRREIKEPRESKRYKKRVL